MLRNRNLMTLVAAAFAVVQAPALAATMYSTGQGSQLWAIDTTTGAASLVGSTGTPDTFGAAFGPGGILYTVTDSYAASGQLGTFNLGTGAVTPVTGAAVGVPDLMVLAGASSGALYAASWGTDSLYRMNLATGLPTFIGPLGFSGIMDMAFDSQGTLWGIAGGGLYTIDPVTGLGALRTTVPDLSCSMGIAFDAKDRLFATDYCATNSGLYRLDTTTGSVTLVGLTGIGAPHGGDIQPVPEPGSIAMMSLGLGAIAVTLRRRLAPC